MTVVIRKLPQGKRCRRCGFLNDGRVRRCRFCGRMISKYLNQRVQIDGHAFDSQREADRYLELQMRQKLGEISGLTVHPKFSLEVKGEKICTYIADFQYWICHSDIKGSCRVVEDVKGKKTRDYILKKKLMHAIYSIEIQEV